jgi:hypothetical protein
MNAPLAKAADLVGAAKPLSPADVDALYAVVGTTQRHER